MIDFRQMRRPGHRAQRGTMLGMVAVMLVAMSGLAVALLMQTQSSTAEQKHDRESVHARYIAQAGLARAMYNLQSGNSGVLGSSTQPQAWGKSHFYVTQENLGGDLIRLTATGVDDRSSARQELVVRQLPNTVWRFGAYGKEFLHMRSNARVDSYNSDTGTYAAQDTNGSGSNLHAHSEGDVGSNGDIALDQNAKVWGDATPGPDHSDTVLGNAFVTGTTSAATQTLQMPTVSVPTYASFGSLTVSNTMTIPSGNRTYSNLTVDSSKTLNIVGPANIVISNLTVKSNASINIDATHGNVELWVIDNFVLNQNSLIGPTDRKSQHLRLNLLSDNVIQPELNIQLDTVEFDSNSKFYGTILAPSAAIVVNSNFEMFGSVLARSVDLRSNATFHFDEALLSATGSGLPTFETVSWREVPHASP
jgi:Putative Ice-binding-like adhesive domain